MTAKQYIREILKHSSLPREERSRIKNDLENEINDAIERGESIEGVIERMGNPDEVGEGMFENYIDVSARPFREYKSKKRFSGYRLSISSEETI